MDVKKIVAQLVEKYDTSDPFELADLLCVVFVYEPLGSIYGYYSRSHRTKVIHINENLSSKNQLLTVAHELGHVVLHPEANTVFLKKIRYFLRIN